MLLYSWLRVFARRLQGFITLSGAVDLTQPSRRQRRLAARQQKKQRRLWSKLFRERRAGAGLNSAPHVSADTARPRGTPRHSQRLRPQMEMLEARTLLSAPLAKQDQNYVEVDTVLNSTTSVLENDVVDAGLTLSATLHQGPLHGAVTLGSDGFFIYTPNAGFTGTDSFTYVANDGTVNSNSVRVELDVGDAPGQNAAQARLLEIADLETRYFINQIGDGGYESEDVDLYKVYLQAGDRLELEAIGQVEADPYGYGSYGYGSSGVDTYLRVFNSSGIELAANDDPYSNGEYGYGGYNYGETDAKLDFIAPTAGYYYVGVSSFGNHIYDPLTGAFTYYAGTGEYKLQVRREVNNPPVAEVDTYNTLIGTPVILNLLANDSDPEGTPLTIVSISDPAHGTVVITPNVDSYVWNDWVNYYHYYYNNFEEWYNSYYNYYGNNTLTYQQIYAPDAGFSGTETFTYTLQDAHGETATGNVSVTVAPNQLPVSNSDSYNTSYRTPIVLNPLANDYDPEGHALSIVSFTGALGGVITPKPNTTNQFIYTPNVGFSGTDTFTYLLRDSLGSETVGTVTVIVAANLAPVALNDTYNSISGTPFTLELLENDSDPDGDAISLVSIDSPAHGTISDVPNVSTEIWDNWLNYGYYYYSNFENWYNSYYNYNGNSPLTYNIVYTPNGNFSGVETFSYTIQDINGATATGTVNITVGENQAPVANTDNYNIIAGQSVTLNPLANDSDPEGHTLSIIDVSGVVGGVITPKPNSPNQYIYTPNVGYSGTETITYTLLDAQGGESTGTITIEVAANKLPVANSETYEAVSGVPITLNPLANDSDPDGHVLSVVSFSGAVGGVITPKPNTPNQFIYTPNVGYSGSDIFTYLVRDSQGDEAIGTITINVAANLVPVAVIDAYASIAGTPVTLSLLGNDSDPDGDSISLVSVADPAHGTISDVPNVSTEIWDNWLNYGYYYYSNFENWYNSYYNYNGNSPLTYNKVYTPDANFSGVETFSYTIQDIYGATATGTVNITVGENQSPVANTDTYSIIAGQSVTLNLLANDTDPEGHAISLEDISDPAHGTITSTPNVDSYIWDDWVNNYQQYYSTFEQWYNNSYYSYFNNDPLTYTHTYTPNAGFTGTETFTYTLEDELGATSTGTVTINVAANQLPVVGDDAGITISGRVITIDVLMNDADPENHVLMITEIEGALHGVASIVMITPNGSAPRQAISYVSDLGYIGTETLTYTVEDGLGGVVTGTINLQIDQNGVPVVGIETAELAQGVTRQVDVLANDSDPEGMMLSLQSVSGAINGVAEIVTGTITLPDNTTIQRPIISYTPSREFSGTETLTYTVSDAEGNTSTGTLTITVIPNLPPVTDEDDVTIISGESTRIDVLANDGDPEGGTLTISHVSTPDKGKTFIESSNGYQKVVYIADRGSYGTDIFTYTVKDAFGHEVTETVTVHTNSIKVIKLLNDTGTPNDQITYDPTVGIIAKSPTDGGIVQYEIDVNADGVADTTVERNFTDGIQELPIFFTPAYSTPGSYTIAVRSVLPHAVTGENQTPGWVSTTFTLITREAPAIAALSKSPAYYTVGETVNGYYQERNVTLPPNQIQGSITGTTAQKAYVTVEFDHDGDDQIDGFTTTNQQGEYTYNPLGLAANTSVTIRARSRINNTLDDTPAFGAWNEITFTTATIVGPAVGSIDLKSRIDTDGQDNSYHDENGNIQPDIAYWTTQDPELIVHLDGQYAWDYNWYGYNNQKFGLNWESGEYVEYASGTYISNSNYQRIEVDEDGDGVADGQAIAHNQNGDFSYRLRGIIAGQHTINVRGVVYDPLLESYVKGAWSEFTFIYHPGQGAQAISGITLSLLKDTGANITDNVTSNAAIQGVLPPGVNHANVIVEIAHGVDSETVVNSVGVRSDGKFTYAPTGLSLDTHTIRARAKVWDSATRDYVLGNWSEITFTLIEKEAPVFSFTTSNTGPLATTTSGSTPAPSLPEIENPLEIDLLSGTQAYIASFNTAITQVAQARETVLQTAQGDYNTIRDSAQTAYLAAIQAAESRLTTGLANFSGNTHTFNFSDFGWLEGPPAINFEEAAEEEVPQIDVRNLLDSIPNHDYTKDPIYLDEIAGGDQELYDEQNMNSGEPIFGTPEYFAYMERLQTRIKADANGQAERVFLEQSDNTNSQSAFVSDYSAQSAYSSSTDQVQRLINERAEKERELATNPIAYFELQKEIRDLTANIERLTTEAKADKDADKVIEDANNVFNKAVSDAKAIAEKSKALAEAAKNDLISRTTIENAARLAAAEAEIKKIEKRLAALGSFVEYWANRSSAPVAAYIRGIFQAESDYITGLNSKYRTWVNESNSKILTAVTNVANANKTEADALADAKETETTELAKLAKGKLEKAANKTRSVTKGVAAAKETRSLAFSQAEYDLNIAHIDQHYNPEADKTWADARTEADEAYVSAVEDVTNPDSGAGAMGAGAVGAATTEDPETVYTKAANAAHITAYNAGMNEAVILHKYDIDQEIQWQQDVRDAEKKKQQDIKTVEQAYQDAVLTEHENTLREWDNEKDTAYTAYQLALFTLQVNRIRAEREPAQASASSDPAENYNDSAAAAAKSFLEAMLDAQKTLKSTLLDIGKSFTEAILGAGDQREDDYESAAKTKSTEINSAARDSLTKRNEDYHQAQKDIDEAKKELETSPREDAGNGYTYITQDAWDNYYAALEEAAGKIISTFLSTEKAYNTAANDAIAAEKQSQIDADNDFIDDYIAANDTRADDTRDAWNNFATDQAIAQSDFNNALQTALDAYNSAINGSGGTSGSGSRGEQQAKRERDAAQDYEKETQKAYQDYLLAKANERLAQFNAYVLAHPELLQEVVDYHRAIIVADIAYLTVVVAGTQTLIDARHREQNDYESAEENAYRTAQSDSAANQKIRDTAIKAWEVTTQEGKAKAQATYQKAYHEAEANRLKLDVQNNTAARTAISTAHQTNRQAVINAAELSNNTLLTPYELADQTLYTAEAWFAEQTNAHDLFYLGSSTNLDNLLNNLLQQGTTARANFVNGAAANVTTQTTEINAAQTAYNNEINNLIDYPDIADETFEAQEKSTWEAYTIAEKAASTTQRVKNKTAQDEFNTNVRIAATTRQLAYAEALADYYETRDTRLSNEAQTLATNSPTQANLDAAAIAAGQAAFSLSQAPKYRDYVYYIDSAQNQFITAEESYRNTRDLALQAAQDIYDTTMQTAADHYEQALKNSDRAYNQENRQQTKTYNTGITNAVIAYRNDSTTLQQTLHQQFAQTETTFLLSIKGNTSHNVNIDDRYGSNFYNLTSYIAHQKRINQVDSLAIWRSGEAIARKAYQLTQNASLETATISEINASYDYDVAEINAQHILAQAKRAAEQAYDTAVNPLRSQLQLNLTQIEADFINETLASQVAAYSAVHTAANTPWTQYKLDEVTLRENIWNTLLPSYVKLQADLRSAEATFASTVDAALATWVNTPNTWSTPTNTSIDLQQALDQAQYRKDLDLALAAHSKIAQDQLAIAAELFNNIFVPIDNYNNNILVHIGNSQYVFPSLSYDSYAHTLLENNPSFNIHNTNDTALENYVIAHIAAQTAQHTADAAARYDYVNQLGLLHIAAEADRADALYNSDPNINGLDEVRIKAQKTYADTTAQLRTNYATLQANTILTAAQTLFTVDTDNDAILDAGDSPWQTHLAETLIAEANRTLTLTPAAHTYDLALNAEDHTYALTVASERVILRNARAADDAATALAAQVDKDAAWTHSTSIALPEYKYLPAQANIKEASYNSQASILGGDMDIDPFDDHRINEWGDKVLDASPYHFGNNVSSYWGVYYQTFKGITKIPYDHYTINNGDEESSPSVDVNMIQLAASILGTGYSLHPQQDLLWNDSDSYNGGVHYPWSLGNNYASDIGPIAFNNLQLAGLTEEEGSSNNTPETPNDKPVEPEAPPKPVEQKVLKIVVHDQYFEIKADPHPNDSKITHKEQDVGFVYTDASGVKHVKRWVTLADGRTQKWYSRILTDVLAEIQAHPNGKSGSQWDEFFLAGNVHTENHRNSEVSVPLGKLSAEVGRELIDSGKELPLKLKVAIENPIQYKVTYYGNGIYLIQDLVNLNQWEVKGPLSYQDDWSRRQFEQRSAQTAINENDFFLSSIYLIPELPESTTNRIAAGGQLAGATAGIIGSSAMIAAPVPEPGHKAAGIIIYAISVDQFNSALQALYVGKSVDTVVKETGVTIATAAGADDETAEMFGTGVEIVVGIGGPAAASRLGSGRNALKFYRNTGSGWQGDSTAIPRYEAIRNTDDISTLAKNTGLPENVINSVKQHLFFEEHLYPIGPDKIVKSRFHESNEIADLWEAAAKGESIEKFKKLVGHEYTERILMKYHDLPYRSAHPSVWIDDYPNASTIHFGAHDLAPRAAQGDLTPKQLELWREFYERK